MNIHEYQAKELLKSFGLPILNGNVLINNLDKIESNIDNIAGPPWVVKAQIHAGGRGAGHFKKSVNSKGGVQICKSKDQLIETSNLMLNNILITKQTGIEGKKVKRIYIEEVCQIEKEFYLSLLIDRETEKILIIISKEGGIDIEEVAEKNPEKIFKFYLSNFQNIDSFLSHKESLEKNLELKNDQFNQLFSIVKKLVNAFITLDASIIEINPLILDNKGRFLLLDSKMSFDENSLFRQKELEKLKDFNEENPLELEASRSGMNYVKLNGKIGCMVNGAGLAMATMDMIKLYGSEPANFLDLGGTANKQRAVEGFKIIQSDPNVKSVLINIFGGIIRCDMIASGIVEAINELNFKLPLVVRFQGTNASEGRDIINDSSGNIVSIDDFTSAAKKVVELAK